MLSATTKLKKVLFNVYRSLAAQQPSFDNSMENVFHPSKETTFLVASKTVQCPWPGHFVQKKTRVNDEKSLGISLRIKKDSSTPKHVS